MEGGPLTTPEFKAFTANVVPYLNITTHLEGRAHEDLLNAVGGRGFPTLKYMDGDGNVLGEPSGRSVEAFQTTLDAIEAIFKLEKRIDAGEEGLEVDLFLAKLDMGAYKFEAAKLKADSFEKLTEAQQKKIAAKLIDLEVEHLMSSLTSEEDVPAVAVRFKEMLGEGKMPSEEMAGMFWNILMFQAEKEKDVEIMEQGIAALRKVYADVEQAQTQLDELEKEVQGWKTEKVDS